MQCLVAADITVCQDLLAGGAHTAVQAQLLGAGLPHILLVLLRFGAGRLLPTAEVSVRREQLLLLGCVWQERQQLTEDLLEVLSEQVPAAPVVLSCRDHPLPPKKHSQSLSPWAKQASLPPAPTSPV